MSSPSAAPTDVHVPGTAEEATIDLRDGGPPEEVLEQMACADAINTRLRASGRRISFELSADGCELRIELRDTAGNLLRTLTPDEAARIAAGEME